jgi:AcrR family transcriptional regulator
MTGITHSTKKKERKNKIKEITNIDIYNAVVRIVERGGFNDLTMDLVADEAGISKGALYSFFKSKRELLDWVDNEALEPMMKEAEEALSEDLEPDEKIKEMSHRVFRYFTERKELFRFLIQDRHIAMTHIMRRTDTRYKRMVDSIAAVAEEGISKGIFKNFDPKKIAIMVLESNIALKEGMILGDCSSTIEEDMEFVYDVIFNGIIKRS